MEEQNKLDTHLYGAARELAGRNQCNAQITNISSQVKEIFTKDISINKVCLC